MKMNKKENGDVIYEMKFVDDNVGRRCTDLIPFISSSGCDFMEMHDQGGGEENGEGLWEHKRSLLLNLLHPIFKG